MISVIIFTVILSKSAYGTLPNDQNIANKKFIYNNTYQYDNIIDVIVNDTTTQILDFIE
ncbi:jg9177, partial [Pararge aegeria aegeria]